MMEKEAIKQYIDHTLLKQDATWAQVEQLCKEGILHQTASVCIPPSFVEKAKAFVGNQLPICTVIGFPNGYHTTEVKVFETKVAVEQGADEIDMVINVGWVKEEKWEAIGKEINAIKDACGDKILKVIVETSLLTEAEKVQICKVVDGSNADFIKTSTGFAGGGATVSDIALFRENISSGKKIKASGGIKSVADAEALLAAGATRLGASSLLAMLEE